MPKPRAECLSPAERAFARDVAALQYGNPFLPERIELERRALGPAFVAQGAEWNVYGERMDDHPNVLTLVARTAELVGRMRERLAAGVRPPEADLRLYEDLALVVLYDRYRSDLTRLAEGPGRAAGGVYERFARDASELLAPPGLELPGAGEIAHLFAGMFQVRRAFANIFRHLIGASRPMARFRAAVWQSIFTHDMRRYRRVLFDRMGEFATLITGPSGTGKELAARAIGLSRYVPFDARAKAFAHDYASSFYALNLSALSPTLIESELFGHKRGAFTGALADRAGWLEVCPALGTVFLDEIGDLDAAVQVKLLRVLQSRAFQRIGDTKDLRFRGKIIAATNRDLAAARRDGAFRDDFYYRLCSDMIVTPSLREQLDDSPGELRRFVLFIAERLVGEEAPALADEVERCVERLGPRYPWPGNVRELEQCVRNVLVRREYHPAAPEPRQDIRARLAADFTGGATTADDLLARYCSIVYAQEGTYERAAARLGLDRRTVRVKVDPELAAKLGRPARPG